MSELEQVIKCSYRRPLINLTKLRPDKKRMVWEKIKNENPALAMLLASDELDGFKTALGAKFGEIELSIDARDIGGDEYGIR